MWNVNCQDKPRLTLSQINKLAQEPLLFWLILEGQVICGVQFLGVFSFGGFYDVKGNLFYLEHALQDWMHSPKHLSNTFAILLKSCTFLSDGFKSRSVTTYVKKKKKLKKILGEWCFGRIYISLHPDNRFSVWFWIFSLSHALVPLRISKIQNCLLLLSLALWLCEKNKRPVPDKGTFEASVSLGQMSLRSQVQHWRHGRGSVKWVPHCESILPLSC